jgi:hypothetical protein
MTNNDNKVGISKEPPLAKQDSSQGGAWGRTGSPLSYPSRGSYLSML